MDVTDCFVGSMRPVGMLSAILCAIFVSNMYVQPVQLSGPLSQLSLFCVMLRVLALTCLFPPHDSTHKRPMHDFREILKPNARTCKVKKQKKNDSAWGGGLKN
jgi:hypothetical protein